MGGETVIQGEGGVEREGENTCGPLTSHCFILVVRSPAVALVFRECLSLIPSLNSTFFLNGMGLRLGNGIFLTLIKVEYDRLSLTLFIFQRKFFYFLVILSLVVEHQITTIRLYAKAET